MAAKPCLIPAPDSTQQWTMCPSRGALSTRPRRTRRAGGAGMWFPCADSAGLGAGTGAGHSCALVLPQIKRPQTIIFRTCGPSTATGFNVF